MTLREIVLFAEGRRTAETAEYKRMIDGAYLTARLGKTDPKKFPKGPSEYYPQPPLTPKQRAERNAARMRALRDSRNAAIKTKKTAPPVVKRSKKKEK